MKKVLVVEDNELAGRMVKTYLGRYGCEVATCSSPFGVLNKVREFGPEVVLLDVNMPGLSGKAVAGLLIKSQGKYSGKTILFSGETEDLLKQMVEEGLADGYFAKTRSLNGLLELINNVSSEGAASTALYSGVVS